MRKLKKCLSIILAALMIMSVMAVSAGASSYVTNKLEYYNVAETPTYSETFDTEMDVDNFVSGATFDEENQRMEIKRATDTKAANYYAVFPDVNQSSYFEFDVLADSSIQRVEYRLTPSNDTDARQTRLYFFNDGTISSLFGNGDRYDANIKAKVGEMNSIKMLIDYETQRGYMWVNNSLCQWKVDNGKLCDGFTLISNELATSTGVINIHIPKETGTGSIYIDNFKITPLKKNGYKPVSNGTNLCDETFEGYKEGSIATVDPSDESASIPKEGYESLVSDKGFLSNIVGGNDASNANLSEIVKENGNNCLKSTAVLCNLYFSNVIGYSEPKEYLALQFKVKASLNSGNLQVGIGARSGSNHNIRLILTSEGAMLNGGTAVDNKNYLDGNWHTVTYLFKFGEKGNYSIWTDNIMIFKEKEYNKAPSVKYPVNSIYLRHGGGTVWVDDVIAFEPDESFFNVEKMDAALAGYADFTVAGDDTFPVDFSADVLKEVAGITSETATATFTDSKGYFNGTNIVFPLFGGTTDVLVEISDGNVKTMKEFTNVPIMPAYSNIVKNISQEAPTVTASFNAGTITAERRNSASDIPGRLTIFAAIYDKTTGKLLKVQQQADTLGEDGQFECVLDLSTFENDALANTETKLFIFENGTLVPLN